MRKPPISPLLIVGVLLILGLVVAVLVVSLRFGSNYRSLVDIPVSLESNYQEAEFAVRKITLVDRVTGQRIEIGSSGEVRIIENGQLANRGLISNSRLLELFRKLSKQEFDALVKGYFSADLNLSIIIETTQGTKTVEVNNQQPETEPPPPVIEDIIEDIEDIEDDVAAPTPPPPIIPTPTPPAPGSSPLPTPTPPAPTPTPGVTPAPSPTPDPFSCEQLNQHGVTVSNIRCLDPNQ